VIELGTLAYPYKYLGLPFVEIANYHYNANRTVQVLIKGGTTNYLRHSMNLVLKLSNLSVSTYSIRSNGSVVIGATIAKIVIRENNDPYVSPFSHKTAFNLLANTDLHL
jgi:hypothetical protein